MKLTNLRHTHQSADIPDTSPDVPDSSPDVSDTSSDIPINRRESASYKGVDVSYTVPDVSDTLPDIPDVRHIPNSSISQNKTNDSSCFINKIDKMRAFYEFLDDAVNNNWRLTNEYLAELLQVDIEEIRKLDSWFFAGYDFNKFYIDLGEEAKEEWWGVDNFIEEQNGVTYLGKSLEKDKSISNQVDQD